MQSDARTLVSFFIVQDPRLTFARNALAVAAINMY